MSEQAPLFPSCVTQEQRIAGAAVLADAAERQLTERPDWTKNRSMRKFMEHNAKVLRHRATGIAEGWWTEEMERASHVEFA